MDMAIQWTQFPHLDAQLRQCCRDGLSSGRTARLLANMPGGCRITRASVIGRAYRLGINFRSQTTRVQRRDSARQARSVAIANKAVREKAKARVMPPAPRVKDDEEFAAAISRVDRQRARELPPLRASLIDLEPGECKFPYDDDAHRFCGRPRVRGVAYCIAHAALCFKGPDEQAAEPRQVLDVSFRVEKATIAAIETAEEFTAST